MPTATAIVTTAGLLAGTCLVAAPPAFAGEVIASDATVAEASVAVAATVPTAVASKPRTIVVTSHGGRSVVLFAKGERIRRVLAPGSRPAVFTGLTPGRVYTVAVGGQPVGAVAALDRPASASGLVVRTTDTPGTVSLAWRHLATAATGGRSVTYDVLAQSSGSRVDETVVGARTAMLTGLDPQAVYTFSVTPRNDAGAGKATRAAMTRSLASLSGSGASTGLPVATTGASSASTYNGGSTNSAESGSSAPARPVYTTIYVCPDGYTEANGGCITSLPYTFHKETRTVAYTYHEEQVVDTKAVSATFDGTAWTWTCPTGYNAGGGQWGIGVCKGLVTATVKDAPPIGWYDTGTAFAQDYDVKDPMPAGFLDDGNQWIKTAAKIAKEVPA
jgi:hypothetical protein